MGVQFANASQLHHNVRLKRQFMRRLYAKHKGGKPSTQRDHHMVKNSERDIQHIGIIFTFKRNLLSLKFN